jgi:hypothetical protein
MDVSGPFHAPSALTPGKNEIRGCVGHRAGLDKMEKGKIS